MRFITVCCTSKHGWVRLFGRLAFHWTATAPLFSEREHITPAHIRIPVGRYGFRFWFGS